MFDRIKDLIWDIKTFKRQQEAKKELKQAENKYPNFWHEFHIEKLYYRRKYFGTRGPGKIEIMRFLIRKYEDGYEDSYKKDSYLFGFEYAPEGNHIRTRACAPNLFFYLNYKPETNDLSISIEIKDGWQVYGNPIQKFKGNIFNLKTGEVYYNFSSENFWVKYYNERKEKLANRMSNGMPYSSDEVENFEHICRKAYERICEERICGKNYNDEVPYSLVGEDYPYLLDGVNHDDIRMNIDAEYYNPRSNKVEKMLFKNVWPCCKCDKYSIVRNSYGSSFDKMSDNLCREIPFWKILDEDFDYLSNKMNREALRLKS